MKVFRLYAYSFFAYWHSIFSIHHASKYMEIKELLSNLAKRKLSEFWEQRSTQFKGMEFMKCFILNTSFFSVCLKKIEGFNIIWLENKGTMAFMIKLDPRIVKFFSGYTFEKLGFCFGVNIRWVMITATSHVYIWFSSLLQFPMIFLII